jgi:hypothetical protein
VKATSHASLLTVAYVKTEANFWTNTGTRILLKLEGNQESKTVDG